MTVWDYDRGQRNDFMGRVLLNLDTLEPERPHDLWCSITDGAAQGSIHFSVLVSNKKLITSNGAAEATEGAIEAVGSGAAPDELVERYKLQNSFDDLLDVGHLTVKVFKGCGLLAADLNGKSDPYCTLQLCNARLQTQVEYKTLDPEWNRIFTFPVKDLHDVIDINVYDMDQDKKADFLGRVAIPLLRMHNRERRWYALKDKSLLRRTKGAILLEMDLVYNDVRAAVRTLHPRETRYDVVEPKFKRQVRHLWFQDILTKPFEQKRIYKLKCAHVD